LDGDKMGINKKKLLKNGNSKLGPKVLTWSLPPITTCRPSTWCIKNCYAQKGTFRFKNVKEALDRNLIASKQEDFEEKVIGQINRAQTRFVRIHVSGDFYSEEYIDKWINIVQACKQSIFLFYTRRSDFITKIEELSKEPNVAAFESLDETMNQRLMSFIPFATVEDSAFDSLADRKCDMGCAECNYKCWTNVGKSVMFKKH